MLDNHYNNQGINMIIITSDINKQTYIPAPRVFSLYLLFYKRKHPKTLGYVSVP